MKHPFKYLLSASVLTIGLTFATPQAQASCVDYPYMGTICWTAGFYCPNGYAEAAGQILPIVNNEALYSLLGTTYGGDGRTSFGLPDLRGRSAMGTGTGPGLQQVILGQKVGKEEYTLTTANLPAHTHNLTMSGQGTVTGVVTGTSAEGNNANPNGNLVAARPESGLPARTKPYYSQTKTMDSMANDAVLLNLSSVNLATEPAGETAEKIESLDLRPPQTTVLACIATKGQYPVRP